VAASFILVAAAELAIFEISNINDRLRQNQQHGFRVNTGEDLVHQRPGQKNKLHAAKL
jgi:hypothetical protein